MVCGSRLGEETLGKVFRVFLVGLLLSGIQLVP